MRYARAIALTLSVLCGLAAMSVLADTPITGKAVPAYTALDKAIVTLMERINCRAAVVAIGRGDQIVFSRGYGYSDDAGRTKTAPDTLMRIASVSKPFAAAEVKKLIAQKKLTLATKVFPLLGIKPYNGKLGDRRLNTITVAQLLEHQGGWDRALSYDPMFRLAEIRQALHLTKPVTPLNVIEYMLAQPLQFRPGERDAYSNFGYCVLGRVIEHITGKSFEEAVQHDILLPLGLEEIKQARDGAKNRAADEVSYPPEAYDFSVEVMDTNGGWIASAPSLCRFLDAYWVSGDRRKANQQADLAFYGQMPGTTAVVRQRSDGLNVAVLLNKQMDSDTLRKAIDGALDRLSGTLRYAAIWEKRPGSDCTSRYGLTSAEYDKVFNQLSGQGYRLVAITGCGDGSVARYSSLWEKRSFGPLWVAHHHMTSAEYQKFFNKYTGEGYRVTYLDGYSVGNTPYFAAIWEKRRAPLCIARHNMKDEDYVKAVKKYGKDGYHLVTISTYKIGQEMRYAGLWEKRHGPLWIVQHGQTDEKYQETFDKYKADGYRQVFVSCFSANGEAHYVTIWEKRRGPDWITRHGMTPNGFDKEMVKLAAQSYRPISIAAYTVPAG